MTRCSISVSGMGDGMGDVAGPLNTLIWAGRWQLAVDFHYTDTLDTFELTILISTFIIILSPCLTRFLWPPIIRENASIGIFFLLCAGDVHG